MSWSLVLVSLIWILTIFALAFLNLKSQKLTEKAMQSNQVIMENQAKENQRLTNLIASKDPMTFSTIQTLTTSNSEIMFPVAEANDDASVANRLADMYKSQGIDPARAYDSPDDALQDFGPLI